MSGLYSKPNTKTTEETCDVLIVGSGIIGSYFANSLITSNPNLKVIMAEIGASYSRRYGQNAKNSYVFNYGEDGLDVLSKIIAGELFTISKPVSTSWPEILEPISQPIYPPVDYPMNGGNPDQKDWENMPSARASYQVGGMGAHWTGATPRPFDDEFPTEIPKAEFEELLTEAETLLKTNNTAFNDSIRGKVIIDALQQEYTGLVAGREPQMLPLACERKPESTWVHWTGPDTLLGDLADPLANNVSPETFQLWEEHIVRKLQHHGPRITGVEIECLPTKTKRLVKPKYVIVAGGSFSTAQLLWNSGIKSVSLGHYLTEHPMVFSQIVMKKSLIYKCRHEYEARFNTLQPGKKIDPIPIPLDDPIPNVWIPYSKEHPYHSQIHRDAYPYSMLPENIGVDHRLIVDLRWYCKKEVRFQDSISFSHKNTDIFGMPKITFHYSLSDMDQEAINGALKDMHKAASALGGYLTGAPPTVMPRGESFHYMGVHRAGTNPLTSVCDTESRVWKYDNLILGGNGVIPTSNACNSTLTSLAYAIKASKALTSLIRKRAH